MTAAILGFENEFKFLSNFEGPAVMFEGVRYPKVEYAFQAAKTLHLAYREKIRLARTPGIAKRLGGKRSSIVLRDDWEEIKIEVMRDLLIQKFAQTPYREMLLATGDAYLEETNYWKDTFWGVCDGVGQNHLGKLLMQIRSDLRFVE